MGKLGICPPLHLTLCLCFWVSSTIIVRRAECFSSLLQLQKDGSATTRPRLKRIFLLSDFRAKSDGLADDTQAFENAWKAACSSSTRATIEIPSGYSLLIHPVQLGGPCRSKVTLKISGSIVAPEDPDGWKGLDPHKWLYFHGVKHLTVNGGGTINGMGQKWWAQSCKVNKTNPCRHAPTALTFHKCKNLQVENLMLIDSQQMHVAFTNCFRVMVSGVKVEAPARSPNTDGIHISASRGVMVKDCVVRTGDDCVSITSNSSRIQIRNIVCGPGHGISIGSLGKSSSSAQVQDVSVDGALISNTENGVRIKTWQGGRGHAARIEFQNILMRNVSNPIIIDQFYCDSPKPCANQTSAVKVEDISFIRIKGTSASDEAIRFACSDTSPCEGLYLEDIHLVPHTGKHVTTKSFCWEAYGSSSGLVRPAPCFPSEDTLIMPGISHDSLVTSI